jgi:ParB-like chromosome segregation protein Spo0J
MLQHTAEELTALKSDIAIRRQVLVPIVKDQHGNTIDGFARAAIALELGIKNVPVQVMAVASDAERKHLGLLLNACRRQLTATQRRELIENELSRNPSIPSRKLARLVGVSPQTVVNIRKRQGVQIGQDDDGEKKTPTVFAVTPSQEEEAKTALIMMGENAPATAMTARQAGHRARKHRIDVLRAKPVPAAKAASFGIYHTDFRQLNVADGSVNLAICDPPYDLDSVPLYGELCSWAERKLAKDGILIAYAGLMFLGRVYGQMRGLNELWTVALIYEGMTKKNWARNVSPGWKPLLIYGKCERLPNEIHGVYRGKGAEKDFFEWQQSVEEIEYFVSKLSKPGDLIVSPFLGSGTDAVAVRNVGQGRRFLGCDIDPAMVHLSLERLGQPATTRATA